VDIFYPSAGIVFSKHGVFQQPRLIATVTRTGTTFHSSIGTGLLQLRVLGLGLLQDGNVGIDIQPRQDSLQSPVLLVKSPAWAADGCRNIALALIDALRLGLATLTRLLGVFHFIGWGSSPGDLTVIQS